MLDRDVFVRHKVCSASNMADIVECVNKTLGCSVGSADGAILVLASYCTFLSYEELYTAFPVNSPRLESHTINSLVKKGNLEKVRFSEIRGVSRSCLRITSSGFKNANAYAGKDLPNKYRQPKSGPKDNPHLYDGFTDHIYYSGYNLFSILPYTLPMEWRREYPYTYGRSYTDIRKRGDLIVDARCSLFPDDEKKHRRLYFEEDTGRENVSILLGKLEKYHLYHLMDRDCMRDAVVFSFIDVKNGNASFNEPGSSSSAYSTTNCRGLLQYMEEHSVDDALSLLGNDGVDQPFLVNFLKTVGAAVMDNGQWQRGYCRVTCEWMEEYISSLRFRRNPYQHREFNIRHSALAFGRMYRMAEAILSYLGYLPLYARRIVQGFPVYCMATPLVSDRLPYGLLSDFLEERGKIEATLSSYFDDIRFEGELSEPLKVSSAGDTMRLRNVFSYSYGDGKRGIIAVEMPSFELGAWIRSVLFLNRMDSNDGVPVQFIAVFDTALHYKRFFDLLKYRNREMCIMSDRSGIYGLMTADIGEEHSIFAVMDDGRGGMEKLNLMAAFSSGE